MRLCSTLTAPIAERARELPVSRCNDDHGKLLDSQRREQGPALHPDVAVETNGRKIAQSGRQAEAATLDSAPPHLGRCPTIVSCASVFIVILVLLNFSVRHSVSAAAHYLLVVEELQGGPRTQALARIKSQSSAHALQRVTIAVSSRAAVLAVPSMVPDQKRIERKSVSMMVSKTYYRAVRARSSPSEPPLRCHVVR